MDKERLLKRVFPTADFEIPGVGVVKLRGLSRGEVLEMNDRQPNPIEFDRFVLSRTMVDPKMTEDEVGEWQKVALPNEIGRVVEEVLKLSGLQPGADKSSL